MRPYATKVKKKTHPYTPKPPGPLGRITNQFLREYVLCSISFLAFVVRHCKIQDRKTQTSIPFNLWPGQAKVAPLFLTSKRLIILKARQLGLTWLAAAYCLWRAIFHPNELIVIISAKEDLAVEFLERVKYMFDRLPMYLKPRVYKRTTTELSFGYEQKDRLGNVVLKGIASVIKSLPSTPDAGQSKTISLLVMDETAINPYNKEIWSAAQPTLEHSDGAAIIISNPTKTGKGWGWTRKLYTDSVKGLNTFKRIFLDPFVVPTRNPATFVADLMKQEGLTEEDRIMQYPLTEQEAISSVAGSYFGQYIIRYSAIPGVIGNFKLDRKRNLIVFEEDPKGIVELWRWPQRKWVNRYAIGSDVGEGTGGSYSVSYVYDRQLEEIVCRMRSNKIEADRWANLLIYQGIYYTRAMIGAERMGPGITTVQHLQKKYTHLYMRRREGRTKGTFTYEVGFHTSDESKRLALSHLKAYYRDVFRYVPCGYLLDESGTFIEQEGGGGLSAETGAFDDCVMAMAITLVVSKSMPECTAASEAQEKGWRDRLFGDVERLKAYSIADM